MNKTKTFVFVYVFIFGVVFIFSTSLFAFTIVPNESLYWDQITNVESTGNVGVTPALIYDGSDNPIIAYSDDTNFTAKTATRSGGGSWSFSTIESGTNFFHWFDIEINSGNPSVTYKDFNGVGLRYAVQSGGSWNIETVYSGNAGDYSSLDFNSSGNPGVAFFDAANFSARYAEKNGSWTNTFIEGTPSAKGRFNDVEFDAFDNPRVAYTSTESGASLIYRSDAVTGAKEIVDSNLVNATYSDLEITSGGISQISYRKDGDLKFATKSGTWSLETVYSGGNIFDTSLVLDNDNNAFIAFVDDLDDSVKVATNIGGSWVISTVDSFTALPHYPSIDLDSNGNLGIVYYDDVADDLYLAEAEYGNINDGAVANVPVRTDFRTYTDADTAGGVEVSGSFIGDGRFFQHATTKTAQDFHDGVGGYVLKTIGLGIEDTVLSGNAQLIFNYADILGSLTTLGLDGKNLSVAHFNEITMMYEILPIVSLNLASNKLAVTTSSFSDFALVASPEPITLILLSSALLGLLPIRKRK